MQVLVKPKRSVFGGASGEPVDRDFSDVRDGDGFSGAGPRGHRRSQSALG